MHVSFALFADAANLSQEGKLNILGVFDAVQVASMPTVHPRATLVLRLKGSGSDVGRHTVTLRWFNPTGSELWSSLGELDVGAAGPPHQLATEMDLPLIAAIDLPLDEVGSYTMQVALDDKVHASVRLQVRMGAPILPATSMVS